VATEPVARTVRAISTSIASSSHCHCLGSQREHNHLFAHKPDDQPNRSFGCARQPTAIPILGIQDADIHGRLLESLSDNARTIDAANVETTKVPRHQAILASPIVVMNVN
jgi:hypothetical protein